MTSIGRGGLQFMLIIWLQGIWLPLHGYNFEQTPLWAGIYLLPLTVGFLIAGPVSGVLSDRFGVRMFAVAGLVLVAASMVALMIIPVNFPYWLFASVLLLNGIGSGLFTAPNTSAVMGAVPANQRGAASGMRATFFNSGSALSIGIFFTFMIVGLSSTLPSALSSGLRGQGVPGAVADQVAGLPPVGSLFAAFLGFNPIQELLAPSGVLQHLPAANVATLTGKEFFPELISGPFQHGLFAAFLAALIMTLVGVVASALQGKEPAIELELPIAAPAPGPDAMPVPTPTTASRAGTHGVAPDGAAASNGSTGTGSNGPTEAGSTGPTGAGSTGTASDGAGSTGAASNGSNGPGSNGADSNRAASNGADSNGAVDGLTSAGAMKDRLLRVLLADPARALRAVDDLESSKGQLDQLRESLDVQREQLAGAARRLRQAGLSPAQVARLAGGSGREIAELLGEPSPSDPRSGAPAQINNH
jgi:MFS family permease